MHSSAATNRVIYIYIQPRPIAYYAMSRLNNHVSSMESLGLLGFAGKVEVQTPLGQKLLVRSYGAV